MRRKVLAIPYAEWKKMGFSKGTLHYLKKNARDGKPFTMNKHVEQAFAGAAGAMGMPSFIIYCMHVTGLPYLIPRHTLSSII